MGMADERPGRDVVSARAPSLASKGLGTLIARSMERDPVLLAARHGAERQRVTSLNGSMLQSRARLESHGV